VQTRRFKLSNARFAVVADSLYDRKVEFIAAGNVYYTRPKELTCLLKAAEKAGICLDHPRSTRAQTRKSLEFLRRIGTNQAFRNESRDLTRAADFMNDEVPRVFVTPK
jgi:hypothetical protein